MRSAVVRGIGLSEQRLEMLGVVDPTQEVQRLAIAVVGVENLTRVKGLESTVRKEVSAMLIKTGRFQGVERKPEAIDKILAEQRYQNLGMVDASVELGKFLGADYVAVATVYKPFANVPSVSFSVIGKEEKEEKTRFRYAVSLDVAIFDVNTKEKILVNSKRAEIDVRIVKDKDEKYKAFTNRSTHFAECIKKACERMVKEIQRDIPISGNIVERINEQVVGINLGKVHGIREKQGLMVFRLKELGKTPEGKPIIGGLEEIAELKVTTVDEKFSSAKVTKLFQSHSIAVGDLVITVD